MEEQAIPQRRSPGPVGERRTVGGPRVDAPPVLTLWAATPRSVGRARRELGRVLDAWGMAALAEVAGLVLSELMTNAVVHGHVKGREVGTRFVRRADGVRIEVHDAKEAKPEVRATGADEESGRGLALVDALTGSRWGVAEREGPGKFVWAEVGAASSKP